MSAEKIEAELSAGATAQLKKLVGRLGRKEAKRRALAFLERVLGRLDNNQAKEDPVSKKKSKKSEKKLAKGDKKKLAKKLARRERKLAKRDAKIEKLETALAAASVMVETEASRAAHVEREAKHAAPPPEASSSNGGEFAFWKRLSDSEVESHLAERKAAMGLATK